MFGYATSIRSISQGRAIFTMQFTKYDKVPESISKDIIERKI
jgi:elongation factor G